MFETIFPSSVTGDVVSSVVNACRPGSVCKPDTKRDSEFPKTMMIRGTTRMPGIFMNSMNMIMFCHPCEDAFLLG